MGEVWVYLTGMFWIGGAVALLWWVLTGLLERWVL